MLSCAVDLGCYFNLLKWSDILKHKVFERGAWGEAILSAALPKQT